MIGHYGKSLYLSYLPSFFAFFFFLSHTVPVLCAFFCFFSNTRILHTHSPIPHISKLHARTHTDCVVQGYDKTPKCTAVVWLPSCVVQATVLKDSKCRRCSSASAAGNVSRVFYLWRSMYCSCCTSNAFFFVNVFSSSLQTRRGWYVSSD